jgi:DNA-binding HxlR family transcriptional regulator
MQHDNQAFPDCPLEYAISILGGKWKSRVLWTIYTSKSIRFNQLKRELNGITDMMLTKILKEFVVQNIVIRHQYNEVPPRVEYSLSENGLKLVESLSEIRKWSREVH